MKKVVGVYKSNEDAVNAVNELKSSGYPADKISLISRADIVNDHLHIKSHHTVEKAEVSVGVSAGALLGVLTGVGIFAIPGLGFLYGAGAVVGAIAGVDLGIMGGGLAAILTHFGIDEANAAKYEKQLKEGKYLVFAEGGEEDIEKAHKTLHTQGLDVELDVH